MSRISIFSLLPPAALLVCSCAFHRTEVPWHLRTGAEEPVVDADGTDDGSALPASEEVPEELFDEPTADADGMHPPEHHDVEWSEPELVELSLFLHATLIDPGQNELGRVVDVLIDPERRAVAGLFAGSPEGGRPAFVPYAGVVDHDDTGLILTAEAAGELAADQRELAIAALFHGRELETFEGEVGDIDLQEGEEEIRVFTLTDDKNHRHRVRLAPLSVTTAVPLEAGGIARLEALRTRDESGPLLVAAWIGIGDFELRLRDALGRATWSRETPLGWSFTELKDRPVDLGDSSSGHVADVLVRLSDGQVESVRLVPEGSAEEVSLPWEALTREEGVGLTVVPTAGNAPEAETTRDS